MMNIWQGFYSREELSSVELMGGVVWTIVVPSPSAVKDKL